LTLKHTISVGSNTVVNATVKPGELQGYLEGVREEELAVARAEGHAEALSGLGLSLVSAIEALEAQKESCLDDVASAAVELGLGIARSLVRSELANDRHDIEAIVRDVLTATTDGRTTTLIRVSESDAERLKEVTFRAATEVIADESVSTGSARVETPQGVLVRDVDESLRVISARLTEQVSK
jgi:flagellar biosynthesis/type III secretory pathway protein FliH